MGNLHCKISREKFEPELGFEPQNSSLEILQNNKLVKIILLYEDETLILNQRCKHSSLTTEIEYLRPLARTLHTKMKENDQEEDTEPDGLTKF